MFSCCYCCRNLYNSAVSQWKVCASCTLFALLCLCIRTGARTTFLWNNQNSWRQITSKSISALCQCTSKRSTHGHVFFFLKRAGPQKHHCALGTFWTMLRKQRNIATGPPLIMSRSLLVKKSPYVDNEHSSSLDKWVQLFWRENVMSYSKNLDKYRVK